MKKIGRAIRYLWIYFLAKVILLFHYDKKLFIDSKWFKSSHYGVFTAPGWKMVVRDYFSCKKLDVNRDTPWPVSPRIVVINPSNISFCPDDINNFQMIGNYYQGIGKICIGRGTYIASNVGIITANHDLNNLDNHLPPRDVRIGEECWIGIGAVILPGVELGNHTIVGAGSVVTHSFSEGNCVIAGNPARKIKTLEQR